jgi:hypothetical protein
MLKAITQYSTGAKDFVTTVYAEYPDKNRLLGQIQVYLGNMAISAIQQISKVDITNYKIHPSWDKEWIYISLVSRQSANHPWVAACNIRDNFFQLYRPLGRDSGQIDIESFIAIFANNRFAKPQYYGFYILFQESMRIRKEELIYSPRFSLLKCDNIKQCLLKKKQIAKSRKSAAAKAAELAQAQAFYEKKSVTFILKYFTLLDSRDYDEAYAFLRMKKGKYFGKQRLDTFFVSTGEIIGHLQIFIEIYKLIFHVIDNFQRM